MPGGRVPGAGQGSGANLAGAGEELEGGLASCVLCRERLPSPRCHREEKGLQGWAGPQRQTSGWGRREAEQTCSEEEGLRCREWSWSPGQEGRGCFQSTPGRLSHPQVTLIPTFDSVAMHEWYEETHARHQALGITVLGSNSTVSMQDEAFPACKVEF